jgi:hypothetical protein
LLIFVKEIFSHAIRLYSVPSPTLPMHAAFDSGGEISRLARDRWETGTGARCPVARILPEGGGGRARKHWPIYKEAYTPQIPAPIHFDQVWVIAENPPPLVEKGKAENYRVLAI